MSFGSMKKSRRPFVHAGGDRLRSLDDDSVTSISQSEMTFDSSRLHKLAERSADSHDDKLLITNSARNTISSTSAKSGRSLSDDYDNLEMVTNRLLSGSDCKIQLFDFLSGGSGLEKDTSQEDIVAEPDILFSRNIDDVFVEKIDTNGVNSSTSIEDFFVKEIALGPNDADGESGNSKNENVLTSFNVYREKNDDVEVTEVDDQSKYESSDSEPEEEFYAKLWENAKKYQTTENNEEKKHPNYMGPKVKDELAVTDLPEIEELRNMNLEDDAVLEVVGRVSSIVGLLVVVKSTQSMALDEETILFNEDKTVFGSVFEVFGPVKEPFYSVRFNTMEDIKKAGVKVGSPVYCCITNFELTKVVFQSDLPVTKGSDASWKDDHEPPDFALQYSDDEEERRARREIALRRRARRQEAELGGDQTGEAEKVTTLELDSDGSETLENEEFVAENIEDVQAGSNDEMENALAKVRKSVTSSRNNAVTNSQRTNAAKSSPTKNAMFPDIGSQSSNRSKKKARNKPKKSNSFGLIAQESGPTINGSPTQSDESSSNSSAPAAVPMMQFPIAPSRMPDPPFIPPLTGILPTPNRQSPLPSPVYQSSSFNAWPRSPVSMGSPNSVYQAATQLAFQGPTMGLPPRKRYPPPPTFINGNGSFFSPREPSVPQYPTTFQPSFQRSFRPRTHGFSQYSRR